MKNYFVINPAAGQGKGLNKLKQAIIDAGDKLGMDVEIYETLAIADGEFFVMKKIREAYDDRLRFFACGGDGTLGEVVNGVMSARAEFAADSSMADGDKGIQVRFPRVEIGCIPIGTGNDTVRSVGNIGKIRDFRDIEAQLLGDSIDIDLISYEGILDNKFQKRYCINMFNIGFDCNVVELAARLKRKPLLRGHLAYLSAIFLTLIKKKTMKMRLVTRAHGEVARGVYLLCAIANGSYCGGGIFSSPQAYMTDGYFDVNLIKDMSRSRFIKLFPKYKRGTHFENADAKNLIRAYRCQNVVLESYDKEFYICVDGEIYRSQQVEFNIMPRCIKLILP